MQSDTDPGERDPEERLYSGEVLDSETGARPQQMNVGKDNMEGGGEWPDPHTPPRPPAPGAADAPEDEPPD
jgi:hypothetical protein